MLNPNLLSALKCDPCHPIQAGGGKRIIPLINLVDFLFTLYFPINNWQFLELPYLMFCLHFRQYFYRYNCGSIKSRSKSVGVRPGKVKPSIIITSQQKSPMHEFNILIFFPTKSPFAYLVDDKVTFNCGYKFSVIPGDRNVKLGNTRHWVQS